MTGRTDICCLRIGTSFEAKRWLSLDPCGLFCITISLAVHVFALIVISHFLIEESLLSTSLYFGLYCPVAFMALWSLFAAWTTDPGAVPLGARPLTTVKRAGENKKQRSIRRCAKCNDNYKPPRAHHDSVTGRCIVKMDHYCPWVCNAVGALNHKFFVLFIGYTLLTSLISIILIVIRFFYCNYIHVDYPTIIPNFAPEDEATWNPTDGLNDQTRVLIESNESECSNLYDYYLVIVLGVVSFSFMMFTCCMLFEQVEAIESNQGKIARMKMKIGQGGTELERVTYEFNEMFGGKTSHATWHWFVPLQVNFPENMRKVILGYEWDPTFDEVYHEDDLVSAVVGDGIIENRTDEDLELGEISTDETESLSLGEEGSEHCKQDRSSMKKRSIKKLDSKAAFIDRTVSID